MFDGRGGSGGGGGGMNSAQIAAMLAGYATQDWVNGNYVSIEFFNRIFSIHGATDNVIVPNDLETTIANIEAKFGVWTQSFISALGLNGSGGGGGGSSTLADLLDVNLGTLADGQVLTYDSRTQKWVNGAGGGGGTGSVRSVGMTVPTGFTISGSPITSSGTLALGIDSEHSLPLTSDVAKGVAAYNWGDHAAEGYATRTWVQQQGYITGETYTGTVTRVAMTVPTGLAVSGSPITSSGTLAISTANGYSIPRTADVTKGVTAYDWGNHALAGYAMQTSLTDALSRVTMLEGYFTNGAANSALRLSGDTNYYAWGQLFWQNGKPRSIGSASARADIRYAGSVSMGWTLHMEYDSTVHDPAICMKSSKAGASIPVLMLSNSATSDHSGDHLSIGWGTSANAQLPIRFFGREFVFNFTTDTVSSSGYYQTAEAMKVGYRSFGTEKEPAVYVRKHLMIGNGEGDYFPVTYDSANEALCFTGNIYATGGISALGFQSTPGGGTLFNGPFTVNGAAILRSTLNVTGAATLNSSLTVADTVTLNDNLDVSANARIGGSLTALGTTTLNDALTVTGAATFRDSIYIYYGGTRYTLSISKLINQGLLT